MKSRLVMLYFSQLDRRRLRSQLWILAAVLTAFLFVTSSPELAAATTPRANVKWHEIDTAHFRILTWQDLTASSDDLRLETTCEGALTRLSTYWFGRSEPLDQKCDIVLYPSDESYCRAIGGHAVNTVGSVVIGRNRQRPFFRIELRASRSDWETAGLPHELTHVLFAQRFAGCKLPAWVNEGTALLADPASKQALHLRDYCRARANGAALPLTELMSLSDYPNHREWPVFYGQSLSLIKCLVERKSPQALVEFIDKSLERGYATGLREVYNINGMDELQQILSQYVAQSDAPFIRAPLSPRTSDARNIKHPRQ